MKTKLVSAKLDRVASPLLVIFALDTAEKKQPASKPAIKLLTANSGGWPRRPRAILSSGEFAAGSCETVLLHAPAGLQGGADPAGGPGQAYHRGGSQGGGRSGPVRQAAQAARTLHRDSGGTRSRCRRTSPGRRRVYRGFRSGYLSFRPQRPEYRAAERCCRQRSEQAAVEAACARA